jgi:hypothetical protein
MHKLTKLYNEKRISNIKVSRIFCVLFKKDSFNNKGLIYHEKNKVEISNISKFKLFI